MLNQETKRKIDNARDTLVGKIPVPMSQIEQITLAMTYKFMSDIDDENKEFGGSSFFEGEYEKYAWKNLMDKRLGAQERMNLYSEGLESMSKNKNIPELFRDIFRNAYLPFKDPQTLDRFLKQINEFRYDHSEELGNAFEYLLSTAGSQGDAGQFRTPRHIIDFLVSIVEPTKDDTILDPACGTAGFLISAYKYILAQNTDTNGKVANKIELTKKLSQNIYGYDISHDMVRLSLVNMYLHSLANPKINEYDTLSSQERWNDDFDCILANPPFMTPKGGIEPHSRFSIKANKSEVLFVDYIMEHLTLNGKAGIIVPEGIIFQSANAYKELRKNMIENNFLWGVVSLPSGVFQPYSGVKTSILLFDKQIAKKTDKIIFVKVENDGYDLGAQRREINKNDLPKSLELLLDYKKSVLNDEVFENTAKNILIVENSKIKESGDYNLSGERYRENTSLQNSDFEMVELSKLVEIKTGKKDVNSGNESGKYPFFTCAKEHTFSDEYSFDTEALLIAGNGDVGSVKYFKGKFEAYQRTYVLSDFKNVLPKYLYVCLNIKLKETVSKLKLGNTMPYIKLGMLQDFKIPLPPLEIQEQIVEELDNYQKVIDGAKQIVENYKPKIKIDESWEVVKVGKLVDDEIIEKPLDGNHGEIHPKAEDYVEEGIPFIMANDLKNGLVDYIGAYKITLEQAKTLRKGFSKNGDILLSHKGTIGVTAEVNTPYDFIILTPQVTYYRVINKNKLLNKFLKIYFESEVFQSNIKRIAGIGATRAYIGITNQLDLEVHIPPLEIQEQIVAKIEEEQKLVEGNKKLIEIFENKIKERIGEVWERKTP